MRILHYSDLHASGAQDFGQRRVAAAFLDDIVARHGEVPVDLVVFSGDLANYGSTEELELGFELLIEPTMNKLGLGVDQLALVPGNHDVSRSGINAFEEAGLAQLLTSEVSLTGLLQSESQLASASSRLSNWDAFYERVFGDLSGPKTGGLAHVRMLDTGGTKLGLVMLNSAWRSAGASDERSLMIGEYQLLQALSQVEDAELKILVSHHPLEWLTPFDESACRNALSQHQALFLCGHEHNADPSVEQRRGAQVVFSRAGCLYEDTGYLNAYSLIDISSDITDVSVSVRSWWPQRGEFDVATNASHGGAFTFTLSPGGVTRVSHPAFNVVRAALAESVPQISTPAPSDSLETKLLDELLVEPRLLPIPYQEALAAKRVDDGLRIEEVSAWNDSWLETEVGLVSGEAGSGITSSLLWLLDARYKMDATLLPVYLTFDERFSERSLGRSLVAAARLAGRTSQLPPLLIGFDDVTPNGRGLDQVIAHLKRHPKDRAILGVDEKHHAAVSQRLARAGLSQASVFLGPFGHSQLRSLVNQVAGSDSDELTRLVFSVVHSQELPRTPFILVALVKVAASLGPSELASVNASTLLQSYVNLLLGRDDLGDSDHLAMDYRRREHLLGSFAAELVRRNTPAMSRLAAEEYLAGWFRTKGWGSSASPGGVLDSLISRQILIEDGRREVSFSQPAIFHLFTGKWMLEEPEFRAEVLADPVRYHDAVSHAAALTRSSRELLEIVTRALAFAEQEFESAFGSSQFEAVKAQDGWGQFAPNAETLSRLRERIEEPEEEEDELTRDARLDEYSERRDAEGESVEEYEAVEDRLIAALTLATWVLRSSELVDDVELKERALRAAIRGWSLLAGYVATTQSSETLLEFVREREDELDDGPEAVEVERLVALMTVVGLLVGVEMQLGTVHLGAMIDEIVADPEVMGEAGPALFATLLHFSSREGSALTRMRDLYEAHGEHPIIVNVVRAWAHWLHEWEENRTRRQQIEAFLTDIYARGEEALGRKVNRGAISEQLQRIRLRRIARRRGLEAGLDAIDAVDADSEPNISS